MSNMTPLPPRGGAGDSGAAKEPVTNRQVLGTLGFLIVLGTVGIPLAIILWKAALS